MAIQVIDDRVTCGFCAAGIGHVDQKRSKKSKSTSTGAKKFHSLVQHLEEFHGVTPEEYSADADGSAEIVSASVLNEVVGTARRRRIKPATDLTVKIYGHEMAVDAAVPAEHCLPMPGGYRLPTKGKAKKFLERALRCLLRGKNCFIWGFPGTGKDALVHFFSSILRKPVVMVTFRPGTDLAPWFYIRSIDENGTGWQFGHLYDAIVNGVMGRDGVARPALVLLSDVDRADSAQAEWFRILTDSISGRILGPDGKMIPIFAGTQFVCTANSAGTGDARGRMASANPMDASILDRLGRKIKAEYMDWEDESEILMEKYPIVAEKAPWVFHGPAGLDGNPTDGELGLSTKSLRKAIENEEVYAEFTHRGLCEVLSEAEDILHFSGRDAPKALLKEAFRAWLDGLDDDSRLVAKRLVDPHIGGGAFDEA